MKNKINPSVLFLLLAFLPAVAQNTATTSGNWDNCATWGNPTSILNNTTDTKTINTGVTIVQNTAWSTNNINFGTGNGSISFADATKSIDFVTDAGADKSCDPCVTSDAIRTAICQAGGAHLSNYDAAPTGGWVNVNKAEYDAVFAGVSGAVKYGVSDAIMASTPTTPYTTEYNSQIATQASNMPQVAAKTYPIGISARQGLSGAWGLYTMNIKFNATTATSGINGTYTVFTTQSTPNYPTGSDGEVVYYVFKKPNVTTSASSASWLAIFTSGPVNSAFIKRVVISGTSYQNNYGAGDSNNAPTASVNSMAAFQMMGTTVKSW